MGKSAKQCKRFPILLLLISLELPPRSPFAGFLIGGSENVGTGQCAAGTGSGKQLRRWPLPESAAAAALRQFMLKRQMSQSETAPPGLGFVA